MSLATVIEDIERIEGLSPQTRDGALLEVINYHRVLAIDHANMRAEMGVNYPYEPTMEKVIAGETTFMKEYERLGSANFLLYGNMNITGGNVEMEKQIEIVDRTVARLRVTLSSYGRFLTEAEAKGMKSALDINLDLNAVSGQSEHLGRSPLVRMRLDPGKLSGQRRKK